MPFTQSRNMNRVRRYWQNKRLLKSIISETLFSDITDNRPYADVILNSSHYRGLLDSGATITALGAGSEKLLKDPRFKIFFLPSKVQVTSGCTERVFGYFYANIPYNGLQTILKVLIIPNLKQILYLGIDFWKAFNIQIIPPTISEVSDMEEPQLTNEPLKHELSLDQTKILNSIIQKFPSFEEHGLGRTHLITHEIDVGDAKPIKQRQYAISLVKQSLLYRELDRMLELGVIEESTSS